ncbi:MAG: immune inhibitor A [Saprospiraceae bacterium]|nr:immune inhibitor A [Saprospiraceae bacterium]
MLYRFVFLFILTIQFIQVSAQDLPESLYHKVRVNLVGKNFIDLTKAGIETDHGFYIKNRSFTSDFNISELKILRQLGFEYEVLIEDVASYYASEMRPSQFNSNPVESRAKCYGLSLPSYNYSTPIQYTAGSMNGYFTLKEMYDILDTMAARYPQIISVRNKISGFTTFEGNALYYVKVSDNVNTDEESEPEVLYTALHHAREPNSLSQMIFYLWYLLENYGKDATVTKIIEQTQLYFIPCVNPDGYLLNEKTYPKGGGLWRKNAWRDTTGAIFGVDLNRNYGYSWGKDDIGSSPNPNSLTFRGLSPFSEPETKAIRAFCIDHDFKFAVNYHTFGNFLIRPSSTGLAPENESVFFKTIGKVMNKENNFSFGTGPETVGYTVNGDSDEWMYGENSEKNSILAFTPEVGPSFWPAPGDIDYLNKSCMWTNLSAALLTLSYYDAEENDEGLYLSPDNEKISVKVIRAGLKKDEVSINLISRDPGVTVHIPQRKLSLDAGKEAIISFDLDIDQSFSYMDGIKFDLLIDNGGMISKKVIEKQWVSRPFVTILKDDIELKDMYISTGWDTTSTSYVSAPLSMTDSPSGLYPAKYKASITLKNPVDLSNMSHALLHFYAKWDIEDNYDYVQVLASKDNRDFIPLCGKYTNLGTQDQSFSSPLFDGVVAEWVKEEMDLSLFIGAPKVWIRFAIVTDEYEQRDGFYFDNLEINAIPLSSGTEIAGISRPAIFPTLLTGDNQLYLKEIYPSGKEILKIFDILGHIVFQKNITSTVIDFDTSLLPNGVYIYHIDNASGTVGQGKMTIIN